MVPSSEHHRPAALRARAFSYAAAALAAALIASLAAGGCRGRQMSEVRDAQRVVSLAPAITDLLFALGAGPRLVGRTRWAIYPPEALAVPSVGDALHPNVEAVVGQRPDWVLMYETPANTAAIARLAAMGIPARELRFDRLQDLSVALRVLGPPLGVGARADSMADALEAWLAIPVPAPRWRIAFVVWDIPLTTIGAGSFLTELANRAGASNVFEDRRERSPTVSMESLASRDPDALVLIGDSTKPAEYLERPEWQQVAAVRRRRVIYLDGAHYGYPTVRAPQATADLRRALSHSP